MSISIRNNEVEALIREMSAISGQPITEAVRIAVVSWLEAHAGREVSAEEKRLRAIEDIVRSVRRLPVYDDRDHADLLYDRDGLPK